MQLVFWLPAVWQQIFDVAIGMRGQSGQNIFEVLVGVVAVELCRLDQTHDGSRSLACAQRAGKKPVVSADGNRTDAVLDVVVINRDAAVFKIPDKRLPSS